MTKDEVFTISETPTDTPCPECGKSLNLVHLQGLVRLKEFYLCTNEWCNYDDKAPVMHE